eukprot:TRINITY_DN453_c0_g2_i2.p1 TRINITY_DN453_c0_g2~~TRINITY_DN453_c0_g2_i2.p1  ORF type:complete len:375 (-),score=52.32 TRINITY_DN453_c0_g2_i2:23-1045(-)
MCIRDRNIKAEFSLISKEINKKRERNIQNLFEFCNSHMFHSLSLLFHQHQQTQKKEKHQDISIMENNIDEATKSELWTAANNLDIPRILSTLNKFNIVNLPMTPLGQNILHIICLVHLDKLEQRSSIISKGNLEFLHNDDPHIFDNLTGSSSEKRAVLLQIELRWLVRKLLIEGFDPNLSDHFGRTPVHFAAATGQLDSLRIMKEFKADLSKPTHGLETPLMKAVISNQYECVRYICQATLNISQRNFDGRTALELSKIYYSAESNITKYLSILQSRQKSRVMVLFLAHKQTSNPVIRDMLRKLLLHQHFLKFVQKAVLVSLHRQMSRKYPQITLRGARY